MMTGREYLTENIQHSTHDTPAFHARNHQRSNRFVLFEITTTTTTKSV